MRGKRYLLVLAATAACGSSSTKPPDAGGVTTEKCDYVDVTPTAGAGGTVTEGPLTAGAAERVLDVPIGTALGGYTGRAGFLSSAGTVDVRKVKMSGTFNPSIGVTSAPRVKALALSAGGETVVILKMDAIFAYEGLLFDIEQRLGSEYAGKVILATSHSHSAWAQYTGHGPLKLGAGQMRDLVYHRFLDTLVQAAQDALAARKPAKLGIYADTKFDPTNQISRDRRGENDVLPGGMRKDDHLYMIRVDAIDGSPIAIAMVFGEHGTLEGEDNPFASVDAPGALERVLQEQFDTPVVVMHMQSAGADTSPTPHGGLDCNAKPGKPTDPCLAWTTEEGHGRAAVATLYAAWMNAGTAMKTSLALEMLTRSVETGPKPETFTIRGGALAYAPFDGKTAPDKQVYDGTGALASPIDEFNAPVGAGLCESQQPMFPAAAIPGSDGVLPYGSCLRLDLAGPILGPIFDVDFGVDETHPVCQTTRTTISALRIGDYVIGTLPGEVSVLLADLVRSKSPVAPDHTIVIGYAQGHVGYLLRPEDWVLGGYEPSVTFWGPLEAEYLAERLLDLMPLALTPMREDAASTGTNRVATPVMTDNLDIDNPAPMAGTIPAAVPADTWARTGRPAQPEPAATIPRIAGIATFVWIGDDPAVKTPHVTLQRETSPGVFTAVTRRSGRAVDDAEIVVAYTPEPLLRAGPQTHVYVAEWQAVPWLGAPGLDSLDDRGGVPLGNYRFHVAGSTWALDSQPFAVVAGGLAVAQPARSGGSVTATVAWFAPKGWRLMDMTLMSNQPVPVRSQTVTYALLNSSGAQVAGATATTDAAGKVTVADAATATMLRITDRFGNTQTVALP